MNLHDYLDGTLPRAQRRKFGLHLRLCPDCGRYLEAYKRTIALSQTACRDPDAPVPADVPEELVKAILAAREKGTKRRHWFGQTTDDIGNSPCKPRDNCNTGRSRLERELTHTSRVL